jgi:hypothetical protein
MQYTAPTAVEFLRGKSAARFLNISYAHFRTLSVPCVQLGRAKVYSIKTLREFMRQRERKHDEHS